MSSWGAQSWQGSDSGGASGGGGGGGGGGGANAWQAAGASAGNSWQASGGAAQASPAPAAASWQSAQGGGQQASAGNWNQQGAGQQASGGTWNQGGGQPAAQSGASWQGSGAAATGNAQSWQQPAQSAPAQTWQQPAAASGGGGLDVAGCSHATIGNIVRGAFSVTGENHSKPTYKKNEQVSGLDVMIYYWDDRDGANQAGWWFGPKVGGEQVWAYNPNLQTKTPPPSGWQVPYGGPVDASFSVTPKGGGGGQQQAAAAPQQSAWQQPQQQAAAPQQQQQTWGQNTQQQSWGNQQAAAPQQQQQSWGQNTQQQAGAAAAAAAAEQHKQQQQQQWQQQQQAKEAQQAAQRAREQQLAQQKQEAEKIRQQQQAAQATKQQQQMEEMKRRQEENKKKLEEAREKQQAEQKRKMDEMMQKRQEMILKKKAEEQRIKDALEEKRKAEETRRTESKATFAIRRVIQKLRMATPETLESLEKELQDENTKELESCGSQTEKITEEVNSGLALAQKRIETIVNQRKEAEEKKAEAARLVKEKADKAEALCKQLSDLVEAAEAEGENLKEAVKALDVGDESTQRTSADVEDIFKKVEEASEACKSAVKASMDLVKEESGLMKDPAAGAETKQACAKLLQRMNEGQKVNDSTMSGAKDVKAKALKRALAQEKAKAGERLFKKYDKDSDKTLSQKEVTAYAKGEFNINKLEKSTLDWMWQSLVEDGSKGVKVDKHVQLRNILGVQRELARDKQRTTDRIEKEKVIGGMKDAIKAKVDASSKFVVSSEKSVKKIEDDVNVWSKKGKKMTAEAMRAQIATSDKQVKEATAAHEKASKQLAQASKGLEPKYEKDLKAYLAEHAKTSQIQLNRMGSRIARVKMIAHRFGEQATLKESDALLTLKSKALKVMQYNQALKDLSDEDFFALLSKGEDQIDEAAWLAFFGSAEMEIKEIKQKSEAPAADAEEKKEEDDKKEDDEKKEDEKSEEKKEEEEQKDEEKKKEEEKKAEEAKKKADEEEAEGEKIEMSEDELLKVFAHLDEETSGQISKESFQQLGKRHMKVVKETAMTNQFGIAGGKALRKLEVKEVVEVVKGPVKSTEMKVSRILCKTLKDGLEGWVSVTGNQGTAFLEEIEAQSYKVIKKSFMTDTFESHTETEDSIKLRPGTLMDVREIAKKDEASGLMRMKGRVRAANGAIGWVTTVNKEGKVFLRAS